MLKWMQSLQAMAVGMRVPCDVVEAHLWDYLDDEITDPVMRRRIEAHLEICKRCFPEYDYRRAFLELLRRHEEAPIPSGLRSRVFRELLEAGAGGGDAEAGSPLR